MRERKRQQEKQMSRLNPEESVKIIYFGHRNAQGLQRCRKLLQAEEGRQRKEPGLFKEPRGLGMAEPWRPEGSIRDGAESESRSQWPRKPRDGAWESRATWTVENNRAWR